MKTATIIRHVAFEDLGSFEHVLVQHGYELSWVEAGRDPIAGIASSKSDLLVVLGGPISVNDGNLFPFLEEEVSLLQRRLEEDLPTLGICLGAQLIAKALGSPIYAGAVKEIGWGPLQLSGDGQKHPLRSLGTAPVFHWHGETFDLPENARLLASTPSCTNQAFAIGKHGLALQFHPEVTPSGLERWYIGHIAEATAAVVDYRQLRADAAKYGGALQERASVFLSDWITTFASS